MSDATDPKPSIVCATIDAAQFPFTMEIRCEETGQLLWLYVCSGPERISVPGFAPRRCCVTVIDSAGRATTQLSNGVVHESQ